MKKQIEKEIELAENLFNKSFSVTLLIGVGTVATIHKEGFNIWAVLGLITFYFSVVLTGIMLKKWKDKIKLLKEVRNGDRDS